MNEIAEAIDRLTQAVEAPNSTFDLWSGIIIPLLVSLLSSLLVVYVLLFQHVARRRELKQEAMIREEERRENELNARRAATRRAASAFISGLNTAHTLNALKRNPVHAGASQAGIAEAFKSVQDAALLDLEDDDGRMITYVTRRISMTFAAESTDEASTIAADAGLQIRRWLRGELEASAFTEDR